MATPGRPADTSFSTATAPGWYSDGDSSPHLAAVADAVWSQRRIEIRYRRWAEPTDVTRTLDPHGVVLKAGRWYLVARSGEDFRTYRVNQILGLATLDERFGRAAGFDLAGYWRACLADFRDRLYRDEATVRLSPAGRDRLRESMSPAVVSAVEAGAGAPDEHGWITAAVPIESVTHAHGEFLRLGAEAEIVAPAQLRDMMRRTAEGLADLYRRRSP